MGALRRLRDKNDRLQLELLSGARAIHHTSEQETLWGVPVVQTTQQAAGTAAVLAEEWERSGYVERVSNKSSSPAT